MTESISGKIQQILIRRQNHSRTVTYEELAQGLSRVVYLCHDELYLKLPDLGFIKRLVQYDTRDNAVATLMQAWSYGVHLRLMVHQQLLRVLPLRELSALPITLEDHRCVAVKIATHNVLTWADLKPINNCWLLVREASFITPLAKDLFTKNHINLIRQEGLCIWQE